jgi:hypothetical protein
MDGKQGQWSFQATDQLRHCAEICLAWVVTAAAAYNPACAAGFLHSACEPYTQCAPYTACMVHTGCIPYADCNPYHSCALYACCVQRSFCMYPVCCDHLHSSALYPVCAAYAAHVLHATRASRLVCAHMLFAPVMLLYPVWFVCSIHSLSNSFR